MLQHIIHVPLLLSYAFHSCYVQIALYLRDAIDGVFCDYREVRWGAISTTICVGMYCTEHCVQCLAKVCLTVRSYLQVDGTPVASIGPGMVVLLGIHKLDTAAQVESMYVASALVECIHEC